MAPSNDLPPWHDLLGFLDIGRRLQANPTPLTQLARTLRRNKTAFGRWLRKFEKRYKNVPGAVELINRDGSGLTEKGRRIWEMIKQILGFVEDQHKRLAAPSQANRVAVAASESVLNYVFPLVLPGLLANWPRRKVRILPRLFSPNTVVQKILLNKIDFALAWTGYSEEYEEAYDKEKVCVLPLEESEAEVQVLFSTSHPLAIWRRNNPNPTPSDLVNELRTHVIVYPDLHQLRKIAQRLGEPDKCIQTIGLPAVLNHVRSALGIGLFPGWFWLITQLKREAHLRAIPVPPRGMGAGLQLKMRLCAILPRRGEKALTDEARLLLDAVRSKLRALNDHGQTVWRVDATQPILPKPFPKFWRVYFITTGTDHEYPRPEWREGGINLEADGSGRYKGELLLTASQRPDRTKSGSPGLGSKARKTPIPMELTLEARDNLLVMIGKDRNKGWAVASAFKRIVNDKLAKEAHCLLGTIHFDAGTPMAAPILFSTMNLKPEDRLNFENHLFFLSSIHEIHPTLQPD